MAEIIESKDLDDYEVWSDDGWINASSIHKTIPYQVWIIKTKDFKLECADKHILFDNNYNEIFTEDLVVGDLICTENGMQPILSITQTDRVEIMYDVTVDSENHRLYTVGILSHNTTLMTIAALYEACFYDFKSIVIVANKESTAMEIFRRVRLAYEELPVWLKPAVKEYGKTGCEFTNGSRISISTTTGAAIRGTSVNLLILDELGHIECVSGDTMITMRDKTTGQIYHIKIKEAIDLISQND
jgi:hypothetical protein